MGGFASTTGSICSETGGAEALLPVTSIAVTTSGRATVEEPSMNGAGTVPVKASGPTAVLRVRS